MLIKLTTKTVLFTIFLVAMGVLLPYITGLFQVERYLLTMQLPILIAACLLPMNWAVLSAVLTLVLNSVLLGVPEIYPLFPIMLCQVIALAACLNMLYRVMEKNIYPSLLLSILAGWILFFCAASILSWILPGVNAIAFTREFILHGWLGIVLQIALVPPVVAIVRKRLDSEQEL